MARRRLKQAVVWMLGLGATGVALAFLVRGVDLGHLWRWLRPAQDRLDMGTLTTPIDTTVKAADTREGLVLISAGRDQKVEIGQMLTVYRNGGFIGELRVIKVFPDLAGARVLSTKEGEQILPGDKARSVSPIRCRW